MPYEDHDFFQRQARAFTSLGAGPAKMLPGLRLAAPPEDCALPASAVHGVRALAVTW